MRRHGDVAAIRPQFLAIPGIVEIAACRAVAAVALFERVWASPNDSRALNRSLRQSVLIPRTTRLSRSET
jgi:hypothetical protein